MPITDPLFIIAAIVAAFVIFWGGPGLGRIPDQALAPAGSTTGLRTGRAELTTIHAKAAQLEQPGRSRDYAFGAPKLKSRAVAPGFPPFF